MLVALVFRMKPLAIVTPPIAKWHRQMGAGLKDENAVLMGFATRRARFCFTTEYVCVLEGS